MWRFKNIWEIRTAFLRLWLEVFWPCFCLKTLRTHTSLFSAFCLYFTFVSFHFFSLLFICLVCSVSLDGIWALGSFLELKREVQRSQRYPGYLRKTKVKVGRRMRDDSHPSYTFHPTSVPLPRLLNFIQLSITNSVWKSLSPSIVHWDHTTSSSVSFSVQRNKNSWKFFRLQMEYYITWFYKHYIKYE